MADEENTGPATPSAEYEVMCPKWYKINTVLAGTDAMREAGRNFLPQHPGEENDRYDERRQRSVLLNQSELTLNNWTGKPFSDPIKVGDKVPEQIADLMSDVDLRGTSLDVFCQRWFQTALSHAYSHVLVEFPRDDGARTRASDAKLRPYFVHIEPKDLTFAKAETVNGVEKLAEIRYFEYITEQDKDNPWAEVVVKQIRRLHTDPSDEAAPVFGEVYRFSYDEKAWELVDGYEMSMPGAQDIPLVTFYADRQGFMLGKPPIESLIDKNIEHWQSASDQKACLTTARFPILAGSGVENVSAPELQVQGDVPGGKVIGGGPQKKGVVFGPYTLLFTPQPQGKFYYVEHKGQALGAGRQELLDLEEQMRGYGTEFLRKKPDRMTATARSLDSKESLSPLQKMSIQFRSSLHEAMKWMARWMKIEDLDVKEFDIITDFGEDEMSRIDLESLEKARARGDISRKVFTYELKLRGILSEDYDAEADESELEKEALLMLPSIGGQEDDRSSRPDNGQGKAPNGSNVGKPSGEGEEG